MYVCIYIYIYIYNKIKIIIAGRKKKPNRTEPNRTGPSHDASEKRRPHRFEPGNIHFRTEPDRAEPMNFRKVRNRNESNRTGSFLVMVTRHARKPCLQSRLASRAMLSKLCLLLWVEANLVVYIYIRKSDSTHHQHSEGVVYRGFCLNSSTVAVSKMASRRWWCIEYIYIYIHICFTYILLRCGEIPI